MTPESVRQREFRERRKARIAGMEAALEELAVALEGNEKPLAVRLRGIIVKGLGNG